jgi:hypothetical protein
MPAIYVGTAKLNAGGDCQDTKYVQTRIEVDSSAPPIVETFE